MNAIDNVTKYVLAHSFVVKRTKINVIRFLRQIKITCYKQMIETYNKEKYKPIHERKLTIFVSDGFANYKTAFNKLFYRIAKLQFGVPIACKKYGVEHNNNPIERYNGDIDDRVKTMRHFGSYKGAENFLNLKQVIHNYINPHMQLKGKTPAEKAGLFLPLGRNKLLDLIKYVKRRRITLR